MERYKDGLELERRFNSEVRDFVKCMTGVENDDVAAAILLRDAGNIAVLKALHQNIITVVGPVSLENLEDGGTTVEDLRFRVV